MEILAGKRMGSQNEAIDSLRYIDADLRLAERDEVE
jgi:hypothetical protein